jgi:hypothetical protein
MTTTLHLVTLYTRLLRHCIYCVSRVSGAYLVWNRVGEPGDWSSVGRSSVRLARDGQAGLVSLSVGLAQIQVQLPVQV